MEESARLDHRLYEEVWNDGAVDAVEALIAPGLVYDGQPLSPASYRDWMLGFRRAFPDLHVTIEGQVAAEGTVASRLQWRGTNSGELAAGMLPGWQGPAIAPTGKQLAWTAISLHRFDSGRLAEGWLNADMLGLLQQLGAINTPR
ncbi:MAG: ester cyclase [Dehalococcoidia bacterium]